MDITTEPFDISKLRKGDIIAVKCRVEYDFTGGDDDIFVKPIGYHSSILAKPDNICALLAENFEVGQTVFDGRFKEPHGGKILFLTDTRAVVQWENGTEDFCPRGYLLRDRPAAVQEPVEEPAPLSPIAPPNSARSLTRGICL